MFACYHEGINLSDLPALFSHVGKEKKKKKKITYIVTIVTLLCVAFCENNLSIPTSEAHTYLCSVCIVEEPSVCRRYQAFKCPPVSLVIQLIWRFCGGFLFTHNYSNTF